MRVKGLRAHLIWSLTLLCVLHLHGESDLKKEKKDDLANFSFGQQGLVFWFPMVYFGCCIPNWKLKRGLLKKITK